MSKIKDYVGSIIDNRGKNPPYYSENGKYLVLDNFLINGDRYPNPSNVKRTIDVHVHKTFIRKYADKNDLAVTLVGNGCGKCCLIPSDNWVIIQNTIGLKPKNNLDTRYLYYYLTLNRQRVIQLDGGSSQPNVRMDNFLALSVDFPEREKQSNIADVLSAIDAKIELNNRINTELEAMAKTLYDYWFVQFDFPFDFAQGKPDTNGKPYKSSGGKMVYNQTLKREIPEGWNASELGCIAELYQPKTISDKEMYDDGKYLVYGANGVVGRYDSYNHEHSVIAITCRGNSCGEINITRPFSWITGNAMVVNPSNKSFSIDYLYNTLKRSAVKKVITGSAQPQITRTNLSPLKIISPPETLVLNYSNKVSSSLQKRLAILDEIETLEKLRDWLLPMLMNGQVTVNDLAPI